LGAHGLDGLLALDQVRGAETPMVSAGSHLMQHDAEPAHQTGQGIRDQKVPIFEAVLAAIDKQGSQETQ
jgi:hypothetical protein